MKNDQLDNIFIQQALSLARNAIGLSSPNPRVGCVLTKGDHVLGQGFTQAAGQAHAEVMAIRDAQAKGRDLAGCTAYVTLEPCSHYGRTPPCVEALLAIKPARVVVALLDANPVVAGNGVAALRAAGVQVDVLPADSEWAQAAFELNIGFMTRMSAQKVFTRLKWAASADGKTALPDGRSQWLTSGAARADGHAFRARADVLVTGIGTVLHDDPQLNVRGVAVAHPPVKCVVDAFAHTPVNAKLFEDGAPVWLACVELDGDDGDFEEQAARLHALREAHPHLVVLSFSMLNGRVDLSELWAYFYEQQVNEVHVEAGGVLNAALLAQGLVDELLMYVAPRVVGAGKPVAAFSDEICLDDLQEAGDWHWLSAQKIGEDMRLMLRRNSIAENPSHS